MDEIARREIKTLIFAHCDSLIRFEFEFKNDRDRVYCGVLTFYEARYILITI